MNLGDTRTFKEPDKNKLQPLASTDFLQLLQLLKEFYLLRMRNHAAFLILLKHKPISSEIRGTDHFAAVSSLFPEL